jgi:ureidoglycolate lyase
MHAMTTSLRTLPIEPLTPEAFAPFGQVIEARAGVPTFAINAGYAKRFHDLAQIEVAEQAGRVCISVFQALPRTMPMQLQLMERHPLGSQAFVAMSELPFLVVVAPAAKELDLDAMRCFYAARGQGVNYAKGTWHHPLIALERPSDFLVIDRSGGAGHSNLDEVDVSAAALWLHT